MLSTHYLFFIPNSIIPVIPSATNRRVNGSEAVAVVGDVAGWSVVINCVGESATVVFSGGIVARVADGGILEPVCLPVILNSALPNTGSPLKGETRTEYSSIANVDVFTSIDQRFLFIP